MTAGVGTSAGDAGAGRAGAVARRSGLLLAARLSTRLFSGVVAIWVAARLGPERMGLLSLPNLLVAVSIFALLGLPEGMNRELPRIRESDEEGARRLASAGLGGALLLALPLLALVWPLWMALGRSIVPDGRLVAVALLAAFGQIALRWLNFYSTALGRVQAFAGGLVGAALLRAVLVVALLLLLPSRDWIYAPLASFAAANLLVAAWLLLREGGAGRLSFGLRGLGPLLASGLPIGVFSGAAALLYAGDRLAVAALVEPERLGLFELAVQARDFLLLLPTVLLAVLVPEFSRRSGAGAPATVLGQDALRQTRRLGQLIALVLALALPHAGWAVAWLLPDYGDAVPLLRPALFAVAGLTLGTVPASLLIIRGRAWRLAAAAGGAWALGCLLDGLLVPRLGLEAAGWVSVAVYGAYGLLLCAWMLEGRRLGLLWKVARPVLVLGAFSLGLAPFATGLVGALVLNAATLFVAWPLLALDERDGAGLLALVRSRRRTP